MGIIKKFFLLFFILFFVQNVFSIQVSTPQTIAQEQEQTTLQKALTWIFTGLFILAGITFIFLIIIWIILKIQKMIKEYNRKKKDFLYYNFEENLQFCHINHDRDMKRRLKRTLWLMWRRNPVYCNTKNGMVQIGQYQGETNKKEDYKLIALYNKLGMFTVHESIIMIPKEIEEDIIKKSIVDGKKILILECEGIDEVGSTDYYFQPLIKDPKTNKYLDFSEQIRKTFTSIVTYRNILKEELQAHRTNVIDSVESNPTVHFKRRSE